METRLRKCRTFISHVHSLGTYHDSSLANKSQQTGAEIGRELNVDNSPAPYLTHDALESLASDNLP